jgi:predicted phage terminase large subunit-like protein
MEEHRIEAQPGPQTAFLKSPADIAIYGGAAGGGKTWALLLEPLRHIHNPKFGGVTFRRTSPQIRNQGGLWDESSLLYPLLNAEPRQTYLEWGFPSGAKLRFAHLQYETDVLDWQGAQIPFIGWDQLEHFTEQQFFYMFSRNRSTSGVRPYQRATVNPDADSWVAKLIEWWIDQDTGLPIDERAGKLRWFVRQNEELIWSDSSEGLVSQFPDVEPKSLTFIPAKVTDNQILMKADPGYVANLKALSLVDRERLLSGNWKVKAAAGKIFNRDWFEIVDAVPVGGNEVRFWDLAATEPKMLAKTSGTSDPDFTAGCKIHEVNGIYYVMDAIARQIGPTDADNLIRNTASQDGKNCAVRWEIEGGASGIRDNLHLVQLLAKYDCAGIRPDGDKIVRAKPFASQAEAGNVKLLRGDWNNRWLNHMHGQPELAHDDEMDAASGAFNYLTEYAVVENLDPEIAELIEGYRGR